MPALIPALVSLFLALIGTVIGRILVVLGLSVVYYRGINVALEFAHDKFFAQMALLPGSILNLLGVLQIGTCVQIMFVAMGIRATLLGLSGDGFKRWITK